MQQSSTMEKMESTSKPIPSTERIFQAVRELREADQIATRDTVAELTAKAAKISKEFGLAIGKAHSAIYGEVNTYHVDVLCEVFGQGRKI